MIFHLFGLPLHRNLLREKKFCEYLDQIRVFSLIWENLIKDQITVFLQAIILLIQVTFFFTMYWYSYEKIEVNHWDLFPTQTGKNLDGE